MKTEKDKLVFENQQEVGLMKDICEEFIALSKSEAESEQKEFAKQASALLQKIYWNWYMS